MMLKVMVYAYMDNTYSSRKIEKEMRENINFMRLVVQKVADHNTIARFRSKKLKIIFKDIFKQIVLLLAKEGLIILREVFTDGTKIESWLVVGTTSFGAMPSRRGRRKWQNSWKRCGNTHKVLPMNRTGILRHQSSKDR